MSIVYDKKYKYVKIDVDQKIFEGKKPKEYNKIAKRYILDNFRYGNKNVVLPTSEKVKVTLKTANEYAYHRNNMPYIISNSKMKASTELDNLIAVSRYLYSKKDDGRHPFAKDGWDYYETIFEVRAKRFKGTVNIAKMGNEKMLYDITKIKEMLHYSTSE